MSGNIKPTQDRPETATAEFRAFLKEQADAIILARGMPLTHRAEQKRQAKRLKRHGARAAILSKWSKAPLPPAEQGVYVIAAAGQPVKIGIAGDVQHRLHTLQTGYPHRLRAYCHIEAPAGRAREVERACHEALAEYRLNGEWFDFDPFDAVDLVRATIERLTA